MRAAGDTPLSREGMAVDRATLGQALEVAASQFGRLSNDQVRALRRRRRTVAGAATGGTALVALLFAGMGQFGPAPAPTAHWTRILATRAGERGTATLVDGSTIKLNGASRVEVDYGADRRTARLVAGQAFFDIHHDVARPFVVRAGTGEARVLGTAFDLDLTPRRIALAVYRGAVGFHARGATPGVVVRAGYRSRMEGDRVSAPARFDPTLPDWQQDWIDTAGMRLDDLVDVLGRQGKMRIAAPTGHLASITVAGRFRTDRPRELLQAIGEGFGFSIVDRQGELRLQPAH